MADPLNDIRWKFSRAQEHVSSVNDLAKSFLKSKFCTFLREQDAQGRLVLKVGEVKPLPPMFGVLVGEAAHQIRSTLDHLMYLLANPTTERQKRDVQFPLVSHRRLFKDTRRRMPGVARGVRTLVESLQPYHRRKWPETELLGQIQEINNWDKHRAIAVAAARLEDVTLDITITGEMKVLGQETFRGSLKPGAIIARLQMVGHAEVGDKVYVNPKLALLPVFDSGMPKPIANIPVVPILGGAGQFIEDTVLPMLQRFL